MEHFSSLSQYANFAISREFVLKEESNPFHYKENNLEKIGTILAMPLYRPTDFILRNIHNPLLITAIVIAQIALTTLVFYPAFIPGLASMIVLAKASLFLVTQSLILGIGLKTLGHLTNKHLMQAWDRKEIVPIRIGTAYLR